MTTIINQASTTYQFDGSSEIKTSTSNENRIELTTSQDLSVTKTSNTTTFENGSIVTYTISIVNTSSNFLTGVRVIDNLGGGNLAYVLGSARLSTAGQSYAVTPISTSPLTFTLQELPAGATMTLVYSAQVLFNLPSSITSITNNVQSIGYTSTGTITGNDNFTITRGSSTNRIVVSKSASQDSVFPNQAFSYFINLANTNNINAITSTTTDKLPANFVITSITLRVGSGTTTTLNATDYTLSPENLLTIPSTSGPIISVPANGDSLITINGYFN